MGIYKQKYWQIHPGKNLFLCDGRCVSAANIGLFTLSFWLIVITTALFFAFDCRYMVKYSFVIPLAAAILFISVLSTLIKTAFSDPGIIPRATLSEAEWIEGEIAKSISAAEVDQNRPYVRVKEVYVNGQLVKLKYCTTCKIFRPPRSSHCSVCDNCVERFDHHCPWVGNCIGKRNYRYFFFFNFFLTIYCIFILAVSVSNIALLSLESKSLIDALKTSPTSVIVIIVAFFSMLSVIGLSGFHCNIICKEISTNEDIKGSYNKLNVKNPYNRGNGCLNCAWILCGPRQPSLLMSTKEIDVSNLPIGCSYRGADGCLVGPVGLSKTTRSFIEDEINTSVSVSIQAVPGPPELQHVNYPRQTIKVYNGDMHTKEKDITIGIQDPSFLQNYGTMNPSELTRKD